MVDQDGTNPRTAIQTGQTLAMEDLLRAVALNQAAVKVVAQTAVPPMVARLQEARLQVALPQEAKLAVVQLQVVQLVDQVANQAVAARAESISSTRTTSGGDSDS